jgi:hypothetical protein
MYGKLSLIHEHVFVLKSNRTQSWKHERSQIPRGGLAKKRGIIILHRKIKKGNTRDQSGIIT